MLQSRMQERFGEIRMENSRFNSDGAALVKLDAGMRLKVGARSAL